MLHRTIEATVYDVLKQGIYGWEVEDIAVILTHTGYSSGNYRQRFSPVGAVGADGCRA